MYASSRNGEAEVKKRRPRMRAATARTRHAADRVRVRVDKQGHLCASDAFVPGLRHGSDELFATTSEREKDRAHRNYATQQLLFILLRPFSEHEVI